ncbi:hypothetical protein DM02DRAFT_719195 [Periconia macrospinosa]|uniref:Nuclear GTPase SLIP-GC n=1 Tax=Periconia macrospinosa TaxID=97972 RepID=A0A2V1DN82_9PLEO|nr:hypothetical protein DM02DRAFT_719195 [Periconia macrospinosa]
MDWDEIHTQTKAITASFDLPPKRYLVGIIIIDSPLQDLSDGHFVWVKAHSKITAKRLAEVYMQKQNLDTEIDLQFQNRLLPLDAVCKNLDQYGDRLIVLRAVRKESNHALNPESASPKAFESPAIFSGDTAEMFEHKPEGTSASKNQDSSPILPQRKNNERRFPWEDQPFSWLDQRNALHSAVYNMSTPSSYNSPYTTSAPAHNPNSSHPANETLDGCAEQSKPLPPVKSEKWSPPPFLNSDAESGGEEGRPSPILKAEGTASPEPETPFDPSQVFTRELSQEAEEGMVIMDSEKPEILEASVEKALEVLTSLKNTFTRHAASSTDAVTWIEAITKLEDQAERERARTVIGVVGNTGAGKSSVINALLDEERLVPTNCMRACTAVVTSISNNTDPTSKYRAEVQFIELADWEKELRILMNEFLSEQGTLSSETRDPNSDAGIAWAKFRAVYPMIPKDMLSDWTIEKLMREKTVLDCLGTTKHLSSAFPDRFYKQLQKYVDSKEKPTGKKDKKDKEKKDKTKNASPAIEYWPLIKEVRIYTKAKALETGAVVVDLPGVHDSNAARAAVAERYMKQCTGLWIVAPITRAVDDKAAKNLLGDTFKRQLKYDGTYSNVTFICSKTDDISITEATDSLDLHNEISTLEEKENGYRRELKGIKQKIGQLKESIAVYKEVMDSCDLELETWEDLKDGAEKGKTVFAPSTKRSSKRKGHRMNKGSSKRRHTDDSDAEYTSSGDDNSTDDSDTESESDDEGINAPTAPLTLDDIKQKIDELRQSKKKARQEKAVTARQIPDLKEMGRKLEEQIDEVQGEMTALCIAGRNAYSKGAIQQDFAAGIRELDMENAEEEDEVNFNPDEDRRDYDKVARSLPVFCVSSRAYQKMSGRLQKDARVPCFVKPEETEVPQLQDHCKQLTVAVRIQSARKFLLSFLSQLSTFAIWASSDGAGSNMTDDDRSKQAKHLQRRLDELETGFENAVTACVQTMKKELRSQIFDQYPKLIDEAIRVAPEIAHKWGYKHEGGLLYMTYKAVCRRAGVYHSPAAGHRDFNGELTDPIIKPLASGWERAFQNRLPKALTEYTNASCIVLHKFHETIETHAHQNGTNLATLSLLQGSINSHAQMLQDNINQYLDHVTQAQREASREFVPTITMFMEHAYDLCTAEAGPGSYMRMKGHMTMHVEKERSKMFTAASEAVEKALNEMCKTLEEKLSNNADEIFASVRAAYMHALSGAPAPSQNMTSKVDGAQDDDDDDDDVGTEVGGNEEINGTLHVQDDDVEEDSMQRFRNHVAGYLGVSREATPSSPGASTFTRDTSMFWPA